MLWGVEQAREDVANGGNWVVDLDLEKFFDRALYYTAVGYERTAKSHAA